MHALQSSLVFKITHNMSHLKSARSHVQGRWYFTFMSRPKMSLTRIGVKICRYMCVARSICNVPINQMFTM